MTTDPIRGARAAVWLVLGLAAMMTACEPAPGSSGTPDAQGGGGADAGRLDGGADGGLMDAAIGADAGPGDAAVTPGDAAVTPPDAGRPGAATQLRAVRLNWTQGSAGRGTQRFEMTGGGVRLTGGSVSP